MKTLISRMRTAWAVLRGRPMIANWTLARGEKIEIKAP